MRKKSDFPTGTSLVENGDALFQAWERSGAYTSRLLKDSKADSVERPIPPCQFLFSALRSFKSIPVQSVTGGMPWPCSASCWAPRAGYKVWLPLSQTWSQQPPISDSQLLSQNPQEWWHPPPGAIITSFRTQRGWLPTLVSTSLILKMFAFCSEEVRSLHSFNQCLVSDFHEPSCGLPWGVNSSEQNRKKKSILVGLKF